MKIKEWWAALSPYLLIATESVAFVAGGMCWAHKMYAGVFLAACIALAPLIYFSLRTRL